ncbi:hypothetical protein Tco_0443324 [Tanacetum coccineum]
MMDNPNITTEEYIRLEEEKARRHGKVCNWETATYGKIWYEDDIHYLRSVETEFPAIVFNDELTPKKALSCEPTVSSLNNNKIDFRISFDESDDEDYAVIFDKNSFSYKIISVSDLKTDLENDNEKVNMPSFPSPEPTVSYFDDLDFLKDFENKFPAIVYNYALTSKSDSSSKPVEIPHRIDEIPHCPNVMKRNKMLWKVGLQERMRSIRDQRHQYLRFEGLQYTDADITDFETRLGKIYSRELFEVRGPPVFELIMEFFSTFRFREVILDIDVADMLQFQLGETPGIDRDLLVIDMAELARLHICEELVETWVASGLERQHDAAVGASVDAGGAPDIDEGALGKQREVMDAMARDLSRFTVWAAGGISQLLDSAGATYIQYSETHVPYQRRRVRQRIGDASTSAAPLDEDQLDP